MYKFNGPKYITRGIQNELGADLQQILWKMIENRLQESGTLDYLQVFNLSTLQKETQQWQKITHCQEVPPFTQETVVNIQYPIEAKVFIIDDVDHVTMLLASEY